MHFKSKIENNICKEIRFVQGLSLILTFYSTSWEREFIKIAIIDNFIVIFHYKIAKFSYFFVNFINQRIRYLSFNNF